MKSALKVGVIFALVFLLFNACKKEDKVGIDWLKVMKVGKEAAQQEDKPLVVYYHTSTIDFCQQMEKEAFQDEGVISASGDFVWVWIDSDAQESMAMQYGVIAYPTTIFYSPKGEELARRVGVLSPEELMKAMEGVKAGKNEFGELEKKLSADPTNLQLMFNYALALRDRGDTIGARKKFEEIIAADKENKAKFAEKAYLQVGVLDFTVGNTNLAIKSFKVIVNKYPQSELAPKALVYMGDAYQMNKDYDNALVAYKQVMEKYPESVQAGDADKRIGEMQMLQKTVEAFTGKTEDKGEQGK
jgi:TolA-binding protein